MNSQQALSEIQAIEGHFVTREGVDLVALRDKAPIAFARWLELRHFCRKNGVPLK